MSNSMKGIIKLVAIGILLALLGPVAVVAQDTNGAKKKLQNLYMEYLVAEGYRPEIDKDGDVQFRREGRLFFIQVSEKDPEFFRVALANFWSIESESERLRVLAAADHSNAQSKVCKVFTVKENVWAGIELFVASPSDFKAVFKRSMTALDVGVFVFVQNMALSRSQSLPIH